MPHVRPAFLCLLLVNCTAEHAQGTAQTTAPGRLAATGSALGSALPAPASANASSASGAALPTAKPQEPAKRPRPVFTPPADGKRGTTIDFEYDGSDRRDRSRAYSGRIFLHRAVYEADGALPLIVFFHGLNKDLIPHRWMGGGNEGDVREILSDLLDRKAIAPAILAGPGSVQKAAVSTGSSFPIFDFDAFVDQTIAALDPGLPIDPKRIVVLGHSGAGCSEKGGIVAALSSTRPIHAVVSIDTCMPGSLASALGAASATTNVVVTWQTASWTREFDHFRKVFEGATKKHPPAQGTLRELDRLPNLPRSHDATVKQTFDKWLPQLLPPAP
jgi:hypothetical protein